MAIQNSFFQADDSAGDIWYGAGGAPKRTFGYQPQTSYQVTPDLSYSAPQTFSWDNQYVADSPWSTAAANNSTFGSNLGGNDPAPPQVFQETPLPVQASTPQQSTLPVVTSAPLFSSTPQPSVTPQPSATPQPAGGQGFAYYLQSQPDLLNLWNQGPDNRGMFNNASTMDQAGQIHWDRYGQYENRPSPYPTNSQPTTTTVTSTIPAATSDRGQQIVDQIKSLYDTTSSWGFGANLNDIKLKQTERDNLLAELDALGNKSLSNLGKTYGGFLDDTYNKTANAQAEAQDWFKAFNTKFGGDAYVQAKNAPLSTNFQSILDQIELANGDIQKYSYSPELQAQAIATRDRLVASINDRMAQQTAEKTRIGDWEKGVNTRLDSLMSELDQMDAAGFDANGTAYRQKLRAIENEMRGFTGQTPFDLNDEIRKLTDASSRWGTLSSQRDQEVAKIQAAMQAFGAQGDALYANLSQLDPYNGAGMAQIEAQLARLRDNATNYKSPLLAKYGDARLSSNFSQIEQALNNLKTMQQQLLSREQGNIANINERLSGAQVWDEDTLNIIQNLIAGEGQSLSRYTGTAADPIRQLLEAASAQLTDKRGQLTTARSTLEQELAAMLDANSGTKFSTLDDVKAKRALLNSKASDVRKYRATQAQDELDALLTLFNNEESRINTDLKAAQDRDAKQAAATKIQVNRWGNISAPNTSASYDPITAAQLAAITRKRQINSRLAPYSSPASAFSTALGV